MNKDLPLSQQELDELSRIRFETTGFAPEIVNPQVAGMDIKGDQLNSLRGVADKAGVPQEELIANPSAAPVAKAQASLNNIARQNPNLGQHLAKPETQATWWDKLSDINDAVSEAASWSIPLYGAAKLVMDKTGTTDYVKSSQALRALSGADFILQAAKTYNETALQQFSLPKMAGGKDPVETLIKDAQDKVVQAKADIQSGMIKDPTLAQRTVDGLFTIGSYAAVGWATRGAGVFPMGVIEGGGQGIEEGRKAGLSDTQQTMLGISSGAVTGLSERASFGVGGYLAKTGLGQSIIRNRFARGLTRMVAAGGAEQFEENVELNGHVWLQNRFGIDAEYALETDPAIFLSAMIFHGAHKAHDRFRRAQVAQSLGEHLDKTVELSNRISENIPAGELAKLINARDKGLSLTFDAVELDVAGDTNSEMRQAVISVVGEQKYLDAVARGDKVEVSIGDYMENLRGFHDTLKSLAEYENTKLSPKANELQAMSAAEELVAATEMQTYINTVMALDVAGDVTYGKVSSAITAALSDNIQFKNAQAKSNYIDFMSRITSHLVNMEAKTAAELGSEFDVDGFLQTSLPTIIKGISGGKQAQTFIRQVVDSFANGKGVDEIRKGMTAEQLLTMKRLPTTAADGNDMMMSYRALVQAGYLPDVEDDAQALELLTGALSRPTYLPEDSPAAKVYNEIADTIQRMMDIGATAETAYQTVIDSLAISNPSLSFDTLRQLRTEFNGAVAQAEFNETAFAYGGHEAYKAAMNAGKTELSYELWVKVRTPRFKAWFGDWENSPETASKVVNPKTGEPQVVYHGAKVSPEESFRAFERGKRGRAVFASDDELVARTYTRAAGHNEETVQVRYVDGEFVIYKDPTLARPYQEEIWPNPKTSGEVDMDGIGRLTHLSAGDERYYKIEESTEFQDGEIYLNADDDYYYYSDNQEPVYAFMLYDKGMGYDWSNVEIRGNRGFGRSSDWKQEYIKEMGEESLTGNVYEMFLNIRDPLIADFKGNYWNSYESGYRISRYLDELKQIDPEGEMIFDTEEEAIEYLKKELRKSVKVHKEFTDFGGDVYFTYVGDLNINTELYKKDSPLNIGEFLELAIENTLNSYIRMVQPIIALTQDTNELAIEAEDMGLDGTIFTNIIDTADGSAREATVYTFHEPSQAKSIYNIGSWSPSNDDILRQMVREDYRSQFVDAEKAVGGIDGYIASGSKLPYATWVASHTKDYKTGLPNFLHSSNDALYQSSFKGISTDSMFFNPFNREVMELPAKQFGSGDDEVASVTQWRDKIKTSKVNKDYLARTKIIDTLEGMIADGNGKKKLSKMKIIELTGNGWNLVLDIAMKKTSLNLKAQGDQFSSMNNLRLNDYQRERAIERALNYAGVDEERLVEIYDTALSDGNRQFKFEYRNYWGTESDMAPFKRRFTKAEMPEWFKTSNDIYTVRVGVGTVLDAMSKYGIDNTTEEAKKTAEEDVQKIIASVSEYMNKDYEDRHILVQADDGDYYFMSVDDISQYRVHRSIAKSEWEQYGREKKIALVLENIASDFSTSSNPLKMMARISNAGLDNFKLIIQEKDIPNQYDLAIELIYEVNKVAEDLLISKKYEGMTSFERDGKELNDAVNAIPNNLLAKAMETMFFNPKRGSTLQTVKESAVTRIEEKFMLDIAPEENEGVEEYFARLADGIRSGDAKYIEQAKDIMVNAMAGAASARGLMYQMFKGEGYLYNALNGALYNFPKDEYLAQLETSGAIYKINALGFNEWFDTMANKDGMLNEFRGDQLDIIKNERRRFVEKKKEQAYKEEFRGKTKEVVLMEGMEFEDYSLNTAAAYDKAVQVSQEIDLSALAGASDDTLNAIRNRIKVQLTDALLRGNTLKQISVFVNGIENGREYGYIKYITENKADMQARERGIRAYPYYVYYSHLNAESQNSLMLNMYGHGETHETYEQAQSEHKQIDIGYIDSRIEEAHSGDDTLRIEQGEYYEDVEFINHYLESTQGSSSIEMSPRRYADTIYLVPDVSEPFSSSVELFDYLFGQQVDDVIRGEYAPNEYRRYVAGIVSKEEASRLPMEVKWSDGYALTAPDDPSIEDTFNFALRLPNSPVKFFYESHTPESAGYLPNITCLVMGNIRQFKRPDGTAVKALFIEEVQSDWEQKSRGGFKNDDEKRMARKRAVMADVIRHVNWSVLTEEEFQNLDNLMAEWYKDETNLSTIRNTSYQSYSVFSEPVSDLWLKHNGENGMGEESVSNIYAYAARKGIAKKYEFVAKIMYEARGEEVYKGSNVRWERDYFISSEPAMQMVRAIVQMAADPALLSETGITDVVFGSAKTVAEHNQAGNYMKKGDTLKITMAKAGSSIRVNGSEYSYDDLHNVVGTEVAMQYQAHWENMMETGDNRAAVFMFPDDDGNLPPDDNDNRYYDVGRAFFDEPVLNPAHKNATGIKAQYDQKMPKEAERQLKRLGGELKYDYRMAHDGKLRQSKLMANEIPLFGFEVAPLRKAYMSNPELAKANLFQMDSLIEGAYERQSRIIRLYNENNPTTLLHEAAHWYLDTLQMIARKATTGESFQMLYKVGKEFGFDPLVPIPEEAHERFARAFEQFILSGKAPADDSSRLLMANMKDEFKRQYMNRQSVGETSPVMDELFGNIISSDSAAANVFAPPSFTEENAKLLNMTEPQIRAYHRLKQLELEQTAAETREGMMSLIEARKTSKYKRDLKEQTQAALDAMSQDDMEFLDEKIASYFLTGKRPNGTALEIPQVRLDKQATIEAVGQALTDQLPEHLFRAKKGSRAVSPADETLLNLFGMGNAEELLTAILRGKDFQKKAAAEGMANADALAEQVEESAQALAEIASKNSRRINNLMLELDIIAKALNTRPPTIDSIRDSVEREVAGLTKAELSKAKKLLDAERKAGNAVVAALGKGDLQTALGEKLKETINAIRYDAMVKANEAMGKRLSWIQDRSKAKSYQKLGKAGAVFVDAYEAVLGYIGQVDTAKTVSFLKSITDIQDMGYIVQASDELVQKIDSKEPRFLEEMSFAEVNELYSLFRNLRTIASQTKTLIINGERLERDDIVKGIVDGVNNNLSGKPLPFDPETQGILERSNSFRKQAIADLYRMEAVAGWIDGEDINGMFNKAIWIPFNDAQAKKNEILNRIYAPLGELNDKLTKAIGGGKLMQKYRMPWMDEAGNPVVVTRQWMIAFALNTGNASSMERLGNQFSQSDIQFVLSSLTKAELEYVQDVWNLLETMWADIVALERRVTGVTPERVVPVPRVIRLQNGSIVSLKGGYFPLVYDRDSKEYADAFGTDADQLLGKGVMPASTSHGFTKSRAKTVKIPIKFDLMNILSHIEEVAHDLSHREAVTNAWQLMNHPDIKGAFADKGRIAVYNMIRSKIKQIAQNDSLEVKGLSAARKISRHLRSGISVAAMGLSTVTMTKQLIGLSQSVSRLNLASGSAVGGFKYTAQGMVDSLSRGFREQAVAESGLMANRIDTVNLDVRRQMQRRIKSTMGLGKVSAVASPLIWLRDRAFVPMAWVQYNFVDMPTYLGAKRLGIKQGLTGKALVNFAEAQVRRAQGSGETKDTALIENVAFLEVFISFYGYASAYLNEQISILNRAGKARQAKRLTAEAPVIATSLVMLTLTPMILDTLISVWLGKGDLPDEDDDEEYWVTLLKFFGIKYGLEATTFGIPMVRDIGSAMARKLNDEPQFRSPRGFDVVTENLTRLYSHAQDALDENEQVDGRRALKDIANTTTILTGIPLAKPMNHLDSWLYEMENGDGDFGSPEFWLNFYGGSRNEEEQ